VNVDVSDPNATIDAPVRFVPVIVTTVPGCPLLGENEVIVGLGTTVNALALDAVPAAVVTEMTPVVAPVGTDAVIEVAEATVYAVAATPLNFTAVAPARLVPAMVTTVPTPPDVGVKPVTVGRLVVVVTVKSDALVAVPAGLVTLIFPVVAPVGTTTLKYPPVRTVIPEAATDPK
jgi:hypothetical protein